MAKDFTKVYENYKGKWVALSFDKEERVVAAGKNVDAVVSEAKKG